MNNNDLRFDPVTGQFINPTQTPENNTNENVGISTADNQNINMTNNVLINDTYTNSSANTNINNNSYINPGVSEGSNDISSNTNINPNTSINNSYAEVNIPNNIQSYITPNVAGENNVNTSQNNNAYISPSANINNNTYVQPDVNQAMQQQSNPANVVMQATPTVEQSRQEFIDKTQSMNVEKKEEKKQGINYTFMIILFVIIFACVLFIFPFIFSKI